MTVLKQYNVATSQWEPIVTGTIGATGPTGVTGATGPTGPLGIISSATAPVSPSAGQVWFNTTTGASYIYYNSAWVELGGGSMSPMQATSSTRPSAPWEGQTIYETDTDLLYVYGGSAWQQVSGGTAVGNSGLVYITGGTQSGSTALNVDGVFTSSYTNYRLVMTAIEVSVAERALRINFRSGGTTNVDALFDYAYRGLRANGTAGDTSLNSQTFAEIGVYIAAYVNLELGSASIDINGPQISKRTFGLANAIGYEGGVFQMRNGGFVFNGTNSFDGFRISLNSTGNISFQWQLYGYRKA